MHTMGTIVARCHVLDIEKPLLAFYANSWVQIPFSREYSIINMIVVARTSRVMVWWWYSVVDNGLKISSNLDILQS